MKELSLVKINGQKLEIVDRKAREILEGLSVVKIVDKLPETGDDRVVYNTAIESVGEVKECDDAARANWGGDWRMPTKDEMQELVDNCTYECTTQNGVNGYKITGSNGNSIFLPAAGYRSYGSLSNEGSYGVYWSSSLYEGNSYRGRYLYFYEDDFGPWGGYGYRYYGQLVRPVCSTSSNVNNHEYVDLGLPSGTLWATCNVGASTPELYGDYFAWGETSPKENYSWDTYFDTTDGGITFEKYNNEGGLTTLELGFKIEGETPGFYLYNEETSEWELMQLGLTEEEVQDLIDEALGKLDTVPYREVTYAELVELRDNKELVPNKIYRITDFVTTSNGECDDNGAHPEAISRSAGHPFDILVTAVAKDQLDVHAQAALHEGDTYFENCHIELWQLWYDLNNDEDKYSWADTENGKGVIYRMIDDNNNDFPYDFKNILFYWDNTKEEYAVGRQNSKGDGIGGTLNTHLVSPDGFYYTFSLFDGINPEVQDATTIYDRFTHKYELNGSTKTGTKQISIYNNSQELESDPTIWLCRNLLLFDGSHYIGSNCFCSNNRFAGYIHDNIILMGNFSDNNIDVEFTDNLITGTHFLRNNIGVDCRNNVFGYGFQGNNVGRLFQNNNVVTANFLKSNFADECQNNKFTGINSRVDRCNFEAGFYGNTLNILSNLENSTFGAEFFANTFTANTVRECHFGSNVTYLKLISEGTIQGLVTEDNVARLTIPKNPNSTSELNVLDLHINSIVTTEDSPVLMLDHPLIYTSHEKTYKGLKNTSKHLVVKGMTDGYGVILTKNNANGHEDAFLRTIVEDSSEKSWSDWTARVQVSTNAEIAYDGSEPKIKVTTTKADGTETVSETAMPYAQYDEDTKELSLVNLFFTNEPLIP